MIEQPNYDLLAIGHLNHDYIINIDEFADLNASQNINELQTYDGGTAANVALVAATPDNVEIAVPVEAVANKPTAP